MFYDACMENQAEMPLERAIKIANGQTALAKVIGGEVKQPHVWNWLHRDGGRVPAEHVIALCSGLNWKITPHELRPDIYPHPSDGMPRSLCACSDFKEAA